MTWYKIYRYFCNELGIMFPLQQKQLAMRLNPIPNDVEFHIKKISNKDLNDNRNMVSDIYYELMNMYGYKTINMINDRFSKMSCSEYPDRIVNLNAPISILILSGFSKDYIITKLKETYLGREQ